MEWDMIPRWMHKLYAKALGYFWLSCPRCGAMFGGHQIGDRPTHMGEFDPTRHYKITCPHCARAGFYVVEVTS